MKLSDITVRNIKPSSKVQKLSDGGGLYLHVSPSGGKLWRMAYRFGGRQKTLSFGAYPSVSLKDARQLREEAKELLAGAIDPGEQKKQEKITAQAEAQEQANTFETVAREWHSRKTVHLSYSYRKQILGRLENMLFPYIGTKPFMGLEPTDILNAVRHAEDRGAIETAHRLLQRCGQIYRYARVTGYVMVFDVVTSIT